MAPLPLPVLWGDTRCTRDPMECKSIAGKRQAGIRTCFSPSIFLSATCIASRYLKCNSISLSTWKRDTLQAWVRKKEYTKAREHGSSYSSYCHSPQMESHSTTSHSGYELCCGTHQEGIKRLGQNKATLSMDAVWTWAIPEGHYAFPALLGLPWIHVVKNKQINKNSSPILHREEAWSYILDIHLELYRNFFFQTETFHVQILPQSWSFFKNGLSKISLVAFQSEESARKTPSQLKKSPWLLLSNNLKISFKLSKSHASNMAWGILSGLESFIFSPKTSKRLKEHCEASLNF